MATRRTTEGENPDCNTRNRLKERGLGGPSYEKPALNKRASMPTGCSG